MTLTPEQIGALASAVALADVEWDDDGGGFRDGNERQGRRVALINGWNRIWSEWHAKDRPRSGTEDPWA